MEKSHLALFDQFIHQCKYPGLLMNTYYILDIMHDMVQENKHGLPRKQSRKEYRYVTT